MVVEVVSVTVALIVLIGTITAIVIVMVICNIKRKAKKNRDGLQPDFVLESRYHCSGIKDTVNERCPINRGLLISGWIMEGEKKQTSQQGHYLCSLYTERRTTSL